MTRIEELQGAHLGVQATGRPTSLREGVVAVLNGDGTIAAIARTSRKYWDGVPVPKWYQPALGDLVLIANIDGDRQRPIVLAPLYTANVGAPHIKGEVNKAEVEEQIEDAQQTAEANSIPIGARAAPAPILNSAVFKTTSTTYVQRGLCHGTHLITPQVTGNIIVMLVAMISNLEASHESIVNMSYGTGTAPAEGAAVTGAVLFEALGNYPYSAGVYVPVSFNRSVRGLTLGTPYWFDAILAAGSGEAWLTSATLSAIEV